MGYSLIFLFVVVGMVIVRDIKKEEFYVILIIGDGVLIGGMVLEVLNYIGDMGKDMIVILNDNDMLIVLNVGVIYNIFGKLRIFDIFK